MMMTKSVEQLRQAYGYEAKERLITEEDLDSLAGGYPVFLRDNLDWAFWWLEVNLGRNPHINEPWNELVSMYRESSSLASGTLLCDTENGEVQELPAKIDRSRFRYREIEAAVMGLVEALDAIKTFDPSKFMSDVLYKEADRIKGRNGANAKHNGPNGKRLAKERIREIWASGKYSSRDLCAEEECAALDMSFSTARKALRGTPDPS